jgi:hypothetical protein
MDSNINKEESWDGVTYGDLEKESQTSSEKKEALEKDCGEK